MKYIRTFKLFEAIDQSPIPINEFLKKIGISDHLIDGISKWWMENRPNIKIYFFPFKGIMPIVGVFMDKDVIYINEGIRMPSYMKLFLALHESRHCDQYEKGILIEGYYDTVVKGDMESFLTSYKELEKDANDFAISSMRECGFTKEMNIAEDMLRSNEMAGKMVYRMMRADIEKYQPVDFFDLLRKQIL